MSTKSKHLNKDKNMSFPSQINERVQMQILDGNFNKVTLVKPFDASVADSVESVADALSLLGGNTEKLVEILKAGIVSVERAKVRSTPDGWYNKDTEAEYDGKRLDSDKANALVLGLAKSSFAAIYKVNPEGAKAKAIAFLQSPAGSALIANLAVDADSDSE